MIEEKATLGEHIADEVARFGGSWAFIISFLGVLLVYTAVNVKLGRSAWDPYPFILLNLFLSMLAAIQAPVIMMSQNRQDSKDRLARRTRFRGEPARRGRNPRLSRKLNLLDEKMDDLDDLLREKFRP